MREILFRGKKLKTSVYDETDWIYGSLIDSGNHEQVAIYPWVNGASTMSVRQLVYARMEGVNHETVGQFTGLKDKNGQMIFEGDIVHMNSKNFCLSGHGAVVYRNGGFAIDDRKRNRLYPFMQNGQYNAGDYRVDGNIHDNPELMEG